MNHNINNRNTDDWSFMNYNNSNEVPLQEPVAFDEFQFSLGLDPNFAIPIPLDMPPPPIMTENEFLSIEPIPTPMNHSVLNENDQKAFSQFLHQFYIDPNMQIDPQFSSIFDAPPKQPMSLSDNRQHYNKEEEYYRQTSILQSLDEQKKYYKKELNEDNPIFLHQSNTVTTPYIRPLPSRKFITKEIEHHQRATIVSSGGGGAIRRHNNNKPHKELLSEEEKRNNHIASEQKRRGMIRSGFKDLTDIVPTLKNINNSKSTVLFKAVDYIKHLEKRNKHLRDKVKNLELRLEVEGKINMKPSQHQTSANSMNTALLQHKSQQKQLLELQERLQLHHSKQKDDNFRSSLAQSSPQKRHGEKLSEAKMDVDNSSNVNDSLIKTTVSA